MYYKVMKNNRVIDVLDNVVYLKWQDKHKVMIGTDMKDAQAILGSDGNTIWCEESLCKMPVSGYETVRLIPIDEFEYKQLSMLNLKTPEEIIDAFMASLLEDGLI